LDTKTTFLKVQADFYFSTSAKTPFQQVQVVSCLSIDGKVIQENLHKFANVLLESLNDSPLKGG
jgi:hypothetical protein